jgi:hypothetical protein
MEEENSLRTLQLIKGIIMKIEKDGSLSSARLVEDGLILSGFIKERLAELAGQLGSANVCDESLVREMNYLLKEYEKLIEGSCSSLSTPYDNW